jgi:predicted porin/outer membrane murein-binding lipoprotein Lpp
MNKSSRRVQLYTGVSLSALVLVLGASGSANAQSATEAQVQALLSRIDQLERTVNDLKKGQAETTAEAKAALKQANQAKGQADHAAKVVSAKDLDLDQNGHMYLQHKTGNPLTFLTPGGEITAYGNFDVSFDATSKDVKNKNSLINPNATNTDLPIGNFGWMPAISTNLSYLGVRGFQRLGDQPFNFLYQFEAGMEISAMPSNRQSNSNLSNSVNGAIFSRNSYIGLGSPDWGAIKIGKSDAPYKNSTAMFNPFSGELGDYAVVMGNTGGDNRVEFGTRVNHAVWYESPTIGGWQFNAMFAPGQNRSTLSDNIPSGESDCAGGNDPSSGGAVNACQDGSFRNLVSTNLTYKNGPLLVTGAYEWHQAVNRQGDAFGLGFGPGTPQFNADIANEWAAKVGALYMFPTKTTVGFIFEWMRREVPALIAFQNERSRNGMWLFASQQLTDADSVHVGWAHAFKTVGDPGQHNDSTVPFPPAFAACTAGNCVATNQNSANMITAAYKHQFTSNLQWYIDGAATFNGPSAHFDLGAGGRGVTTDCHDAGLPAGGGAGAAGGRCFTGTTIVGVSTGLKWTF